MRALRDFVLAPPAAAAPEGGVAPAETLSRPVAAPATARAATAPASLAVLCSAADARALAIGAATVLARRHRVPCALACVWTAPGIEHRTPEARPPAARAARRLASALGARGLEAVACGRAVAVTLPGDPAHAVPAAVRAGAAAGSAPVAIALGGPREDAFDALLADCDRILVAARGEGDGAVAALAVAGLGPLAARAVARTVALGPAARSLAAAGLGVPPALRRALAALDEGGA
jgi:hypothetical protein